MATPPDPRLRDVDDLRQQLRSLGLRTYLIALTGYGLAEDRRRALASGFDAHVTKPPQMEQLLALVASAS